MASTVWRGHLTFGLISIPIRLFRAARAERVPLKRVARVKPHSREDVPLAQFPAISNGRSVDKLPEGSISQVSATPAADDEVLTAPALVALRQENVSREGGRTVAEADITRAVEIRPNQFVEISAEELKSLKTATSSALAIQEFVALAEIDPLYFETSYYVVPEEVGEKAYALLYRSLQNANVVALAELAMHGRDHIVVVRSADTGLVAHTMFYPSETHLDEQFQADTALVSDKELELAGRLVESLVTNFQPEKYANAYQQKLRGLIASTIEQPQPKAIPMQQRSSAVIDIAEALRQSLASLKKPAQSTTIDDARAKKLSRNRKSTASGG